MNNKSNKTIWFFSVLLTFVVMSLLFSPGLSQDVWGQFPTVSIPTVTSSPVGAYVIALEQGGDEYIPINLRSGPGQPYKQVGVMLVGSTLPAKGVYGDWIQVEWVGGEGGHAWVYAPLVNLIGTVPQLEPPPTTTPVASATIDPTLAAQFVLTSEPTRLPTFTEPPPLQIPTFTEVTGNTAPGGIPLGFVIIILAGLGLFLSLIATLRRG